MNPPPVSAPVCFVDTETTGLDAERHEIWEIGLITPDGEAHHWFLPVDETRADPFSLNIGGYHERHPHGRRCPDPTAIYAAKEFAVPSSYVAFQVGSLTHGLHLVGAVVSFDEERLRRMMLAEGVLPTWHYHLVDVEALAAGVVAEMRRNTRGGMTWGRGCAIGDPISPEPPWSSSDLSRAMGVDPDDFDRHTALGDAQWAKAIYEAVMRR